MDEVKQNQDGLVGRFFHTFTGDGKLKWQGHIISQPNPGFYLCKLFSWGSGHATGQVVVRVDGMRGWKFYDSDKDMNREYERHHKN